MTPSGQSYSRREEGTPAQEAAKFGLTPEQVGTEAVLTFEANWAKHGGQPHKLPYEQAAAVMDTFLAGMVRDAELGRR